MTRRMIGCGVWALILCSMAGLANAGNQGVAEPFAQPPPLSVRLKIVACPKVAHVGDVIKLEACLENRGKVPVLLPVASKQKWFWSISVTGYPSQSSTVHYDWATGGYATLDEGEFKHLRAGEKTVPVTYTGTFLLPGRARVEGRFVSGPASRLGWSRDEQGRLIDQVIFPIPDMWRGSASAHTDVEVLSGMADEMSKKYSELAAMLRDKSVTTEKKLSSLAVIASEKHYFAARFVWDIWKTTTDAEIKSAAFDHLLSLLKFGTAYEALPDVLKVLQDEHVNGEMKGRILDVLAGMRLKSKIPWIRIANQAVYRIPDPLLKEVLGILKRISESGDAKLAAKAKAILESGVKKAPPKSNGSASPAAPQSGHGEDRKK